MAPASMALSSCARATSLVQVSLSMIAYHVFVCAYLFDILVADALWLIRAPDSDVWTLVVFGMKCYSDAVPWTTVQEQLGTLSLARLVTHPTLGDLWESGHLRIVQISVASPRITGKRDPVTKAIAPSEFAQSVVEEDGRLVRLTVTGEALRLVLPAASLEMLGMPPELAVPPPPSEVVEELSADSVNSPLFVPPGRPAGARPGLAAVSLSETVVQVGRVSLVEELTEWKDKRECRFEALKGGLVMISSTGKWHAVSCRYALRNVKGFDLDSELLRDVRPDWCKICCAGRRTFRDAGWVSPCASGTEPARGLSSPESAPAKSLTGSGTSSPSSAGSASSPEAK